MTPQPRGTGRLDVALVARHPSLSRRKAREVIEKGQVEVDGRLVTEAGAAVGADATIVWNPNRKALRRVRCSLPLLHVDDDLLVVDKPPGLLSVPTSPEARGEDTVLARIRDYAARLRPHRPYVGVVHRLDRDTSGALALALSPDARRLLRDLFREHRVERRYAALVWGSPPADQGVVDLPIHDDYEGGRRRVARPGEPSHTALTRYRVVERLRGAAHLEVSLETGRQHQIRLHLSHVGLPVLGDATYGSQKAALAVPRQMLHAGLLAFDHPMAAGHVRVESPLPSDFLEILDRLRRRSHTVARGASRRR